MESILALSDAECQLPVSMAAIVRSNGTLDIGLNMGFNRGNSRILADQTGLL
jgi:hypothetical protein